MNLGLGLDTQLCPEHIYLLTYSCNSYLPSGFCSELLTRTWPQGQDSTWFISGRTAPPPPQGLVVSLAQAQAEFMACQGL